MLSPYHLRLPARATEKALEKARLLYVLHTFKLNYIDWNDI